MHTHTHITLRSYHVLAPGKLTPHNERFAVAQQHVEIDLFSLCVADITKKMRIDENPMGAIR